MGMCKESRDATAVLDRISGGIDELKQIVKDTQRVEESDAKSERDPRPSREIDGRMTNAYNRMLRGGSSIGPDMVGTEDKTRENTTFPSEGWFKAVVLGLIKDEARTCRDIAGARGASATVRAIEQRLCR